MKDRSVEQKLRVEAGELLAAGKVDYIVGFERGSLKFTTTPLITKDGNDINRLVINPFITSNLAKFLMELKGRVGIVAKGCDSRSIVSLIQDNKVIRENLVILGVPCSGIISLHKLEKLAARDSEEIRDITREDDRVIVNIGGEDRELNAAEVLFDSCLACEFPTPKEYDILLGEPRAATISQDAWKNVKKLEALPPEERWYFWEKEFSRCTRCYACRNSCPICFCQQCFVEETEPQWIVSVPRWQENFIFQIIRNIHLAGRCTDCGACERACPANIPLRSLTRKMYDIVDDLYQFKAGTDKGLAPLMAHYENTDPGDFIR